MWEALANVVQGKEIKGVQIAKKKIKLCLFTDDMIIYVENPKQLTKTSLRTSHYSKVAGSQVNVQKSIALL